MSKKPVSLKVHELAKELGVSSKDIVARCQSEDIASIVNHLSPVSVGLALTVREWFPSSAASAQTATATATVTATVTTTETATETRPTSAATTASPSRSRMKIPTESGSSSASPASAESDDETPAVAKRATKKIATAPTVVIAPAPSPRAPIVRTPIAADHATEAAPSTRTPPVSDGPSSADVARQTPSAPAVAATTVHTRPSAAAPTVNPVAHAAHAAPSAPPTPARPAATPTPVAPRPFRVPAGLTAHQPARTDQGAPVTAPRPAAPATPSTTPPTRRVITAGPPAPASMADTTGAAPVMNVPTRPTQTGPVGPQNAVREKTRLAGPQVIRVEQADNLPTPPPMRRPGVAGSTGGYAGGSAGARGRTGGATGRPEIRGRGGIGASRTGRAGEAARPAFGAQDLKDRQARIDGSKGFMTSHRNTPSRGGFGGGSGGGGQRAERKPGEVTQIHVAEPLTIKELSAATGIKATDIIKKLFLDGVMSTINSGIDREKAIEIMMECDIDLIVDEAKSAADIIEERFKDRPRTDERRRAPIVTILGHVDHGKTSLLDRIRSSKIAAGEAGGITQSTRAFCVPVRAGDVDRVVTFIDTPGHEAFTSMRSRGAKVTDIVVLVVSAVDGCMPQTIESINHAKAAGVPIVVALNKIDRPDVTEATIRRVLGQLAEHELNPTEWGGQTEVIRTSATRGDGIQELIDILDYQAELLDLKADFDGLARGTVLEAAIEEGRGCVARVMIQEGRLKKGDFIVIGRGYGRVRDIINDRGERILEALPSTPVAISGMDQLPDAGDKAYVVESIRAAEEAAEERRRIDRERELAAPKITLDNIFKHLEKAGRKELALVVKGDVQGSVEALKSMLGKLPTEEVVVSVKSASAGGINESDISLAAATNAIVIGFNVTSSGKARQLAEAKGVEIRLYEVIYDMIDDVTKAARGLLAPELRLEVLGHAEVRQVFKVTKVGAIAGCYITDGVVERNAQIRVTRDGIVIEKDRRLEQLKRFKDDAKDVRMGQECGMKIVGYDDIKVGDVLECYKTITVART